MDKSAFAAAYAAKLRLRKGKSYVGEQKPVEAELRMDSEQHSETSPAEAIETPEAAESAPKIDRVAEIISAIRRSKQKE